MTQKELRKLKKTELLEMMIALRNELDRVQAERDALQEQLKTAEQNALHQVETDAVLAVQKILKAVEDETAAYRKRIQAESEETKSASPEVPARRFDGEANDRFSNCCTADGGTETNPIPKRLSEDAAKHHFFVAGGCSGCRVDFDAVFAGSACDRNEHDAHINE